MLNWWNHFTSPVVSIIALIEPVRGQGLISTRWYVWCPCVDINLLQQHRGYLGRQRRRIGSQLQLILIRVIGFGIKVKGRL